MPLVFVAGLSALVATIESLGPLDQALIAVVKLLPQGLTTEFDFIANLGSVPTLVVVAVVAAVYEFWCHHRVRGAIMLASLTSLGAFRLVKELVRRARPVTDFVASHGLHDYSFPSGHAAGSAAVYGMAAVILWNNSRRLSARIAAGLLAVLIIMIGVSRVYLGAHFPTDVLGGWLVALVVVSILRSISLIIAKRSRKPEDEAMEDTTEDTTEVVN